uniref:Transcriptional adapter 3-like n=1 Tax=Saccoglossus kowalevskii TaxID=10224 RepID=A0ABM0MC89_SACKO|nr:PREDICTED: transcriptional adapter 3-like [Saccoglossus kowalevskii]
MAEKECPLQFHDFRPVDHGKICPRYWAVTQRTEDEGIGVEELDTLQLELETLLAASSKRMRQLEAETQVLIDWQEKKDKKGGGKMHKSESVSTGKRGRPPDDKHDKRPSKKFKETSGKLGSSTAHSGPGRPKSKKNIQQKMQEYEFTDDPLDVPRIPKNDAPNRFWASVEPYCADITSEDLKAIEELIKNNEDDSEYFKIPPLGKHYTIRWAQEDLIEEQKEGHRVNDKKRGSALGNSTSPNTNDAKHLIKKADIRYASSIVPYSTALAPMPRYTESETVFTAGSLNDCKFSIRSLGNPGTSYVGGQTYSQRTPEGRDKHYAPERELSDADKYKFELREDDPEVRKQPGAFSILVSQSKLIRQNEQDPLGSERFSRFSKWSSLRRAVASLINLAIANKRDRDGLIRVGGRIGQANFDFGERHPILSPKDSHVSRLIVEHVHQQVQHQGRQFTIVSSDPKGIGCLVYTTW